jgi:hypothetical protein
MLLGDRKIKEYRIGEGKSIVLQALSAEEARQVDRIVFTLFPNAAFHMEVNTARVHTLARALVSVNGIPVSQLEDVAKVLSAHKNDPKYTPLEAITQILGEQDNESINLLYSLYLDLEKENREEKEKMKNFYQAQTVDSSGK